MNPEHHIVRAKEHKELLFPARIFAYLAMCVNLKQNVEKTMEKAVVCTSNLPFVSKITSRFTPQGAVHVHWSFLKY